MDFGWWWYVNQCRFSDCNKCALQWEMLVVGKAAPVWVQVVLSTQLLIYLFILLFLAALGLHCGARASHCSGFSCCRALALGACALECRLSSCGTRAYLLHGMWDLPGPGLEPVSPALAGRFLTTAPPGKSLSTQFWCESKSAVKNKVYIKKDNNGNLIQACMITLVSNVWATGA